MKVYFRMWVLLLLVLASSLAQAQPSKVSESFKLLVDEPKEESGFGTVLAVEGDILVVGAYSDGEKEEGSVYVFSQDGAEWIKQAKLVASDADEGDQFGISVAISKETIVVGADQSDDAGFASGSAYVFVKTGEAWVEQAKLLASDADVADRFGAHVAIHENTIVVGAVEDDDEQNNSGSAYVFTKKDDVWVEQAKLVAKDPFRSAQFGASIALNDTFLVIGANKDGVTAIDAGAVYIFTFENETWVEKVKLLADDLQATATFGSSVSLFEERLAIGAPWYKNDKQPIGAVYIFRHNEGSWNQEAKLIPLDAIAYTGIGSDVVLKDNVLIMSATGDNAVGKRTGAAYQFELLDGEWIEQIKFIASDPFNFDDLGNSVGFNNEQIFLSAPGTDENLRNSGSVYIYDSTVGEE